MRNEQLAVLSERLRDMLSPHSEEDARLIQKGMLLYRQGLVSQLRMDEETVTAVVQDVMPVRVRLELQFFDMSECSCPARGICRHQIAVFFAAYGREGSVAEWIEDWRYPVKEKKEAASWGMQRARDLMKSAGAAEPDYQVWLHSFSESFDTIMRSKNHLNPYVVGELFGIHWRRVRAGAPRGEVWALLYELAGIVHSFRELDRLSTELRHHAETAERYYGHIFDELQRAAERIAKRLAGLPLPLSFDPFLESLKEDVRGLLAGLRLVPYERAFLYMGVWSALFKKKKANLEDETRLLEETASHLEDEENSHPLQIAMAHIHFLRKEDMLALESLDGLDGQETAPFLLNWTEELSTQKEWGRTAPYIDVLSHNLRGTLALIGGYQARTQYARAVLDAAIPYVEGTGRGDVLERLLQQALPYSYYEYGSLLFERGDYAKWADLQAFMGYQYTDLPTARMKVLEKEKPEAVISMLHQAAAKQIAAKNRSGYKSAVRMLKKLRTLYKKQKRQAEWNAFFEELLERTKRLRAFHEECQRSKLIDV
ncbi:SWIM zinc finger family protein [Neobacillus piezotolerans]|uniref:SWIM zinc finger family protein n=1 Tax=Neobacillus piezotolerans TaxID=2259171 RepID=A0A3D8GU15_9BACI|nr:SWIM zinc finger family protein [Neobacillus piezotolerans]RDU37536.1 SWIM zinc finger family protein [Neobacillus piezotolerans]